MRIFLVAVFLLTTFIISYLSTHSFVVQSVTKKPPPTNKRIEYKGVRDKITYVHHLKIQTAFSLLAFLNFFPFHV